MWRWVIGLLIAVLGWMLLKDPAFDRFARPASDDSPAAPDYSQGDAWLYKPDEQPPGAWETPWGVDVFLLLPAPHAGSDSAALSIEAFRTAGNELNAAIIEAFSDIAPVYAPAYRAVAPATFRYGDDSAEVREAEALAVADVKDALATYLSADNQFRAVMFVAYADAVTLLPELEARVRATPGLENRIVGYLAVKAPSITAQTEPVEYACMEGVERPCLFSTTYEPSLPLSRFVLPQYPVRALPSPDAPVAENTLDRLRLRLEAASTWLDTFATKPAPPLPPMEAIEIAPIKRPGENDEPED